MQNRTLCCQNKRTKTKIVGILLPTVFYFGLCTIPHREVGVSNCRAKCLLLNFSHWDCLAKCRLFVEKTFMNVLTRVSATQSLQLNFPLAYCSQKKPKSEIRVCFWKSWVLESSLVVVGTASSMASPVSANYWISVTVLTTYLPVGYSMWWWSNTRFFSFSLSMIIESSPVSSIYFMVTSAELYRSISSKSSIADWFFIFWCLMDTAFHCDSWRFLEAERISFFLWQDVSMHLFRLY